jgi:hypothetical protein
LTGIGSAVVTADFRLQLLEETLNKACNR